MKFIVRLRSLNTLVLFGYIVVALPLIFAIVIATTFVSSLARTSDEVVELSITTTNGSRMLLEHITALERNARQYRALGDEEFLNIYENRQQNLMEILERIPQLELGLSEPIPEVNEIITVANDIRDALKNNPNRIEAAELQDRFQRLNDKARVLRNKLRAALGDELGRLQERAATVQQRLYWHAFALIPLAMLLAGAFSALIARPMRQLGQAIRQLGEGERDRAIVIRGPLDLEELGRRLDWLRRRLNELEREKNDFLSHVSHELKTPLANIREGTDLLADGSVGDTSEQQREVLDILQTNSLGLQKKIENLLNFNAWQNMKTRPQISECRLSEVFDHALQHHRLAMTRLGLFADIKMPDIRVNADYEKLRLMFDNLISNALKFSPPGGTLYCRARREGGGVAIDVADEGPGIAAGERDRVFEPFYEGRRPQKGPLRGTGIGLSVVRECVKAHGGTIEIREGEYPGAHFHIHLAI